MKLPTIAIGLHRVSRLIIGGNPYSGISHHSPAKSKEMEDYYTAGRIMADLREAERCGINTVLARADRHIMRVLNEYRNSGGRIQWIAQTAKGSEYADLATHIRLIARLSTHCHLPSRGNDGSTLRCRKTRYIARCVETDSRFGVFPRLGNT